jgi:DNA-3-methyladenine glycosylase
MIKLTRQFYERDTCKVARELLGKYLIHEVAGERLIGKIVETEAYKGPEDKAAHSYNNKRTKRTEIMFGPAGHAYVFLIYGMYPCMNIVTEEVGKPCAVLLRGLEPIEGQDSMASRRFHKSYHEFKKAQKINLTNGPGKLCMAMGITMESYGADLCSSSLQISGPEEQNFDIGVSPRINIPYAEEAIMYPWRYYIKDHPYVSVK